LGVILKFYNVIGFFLRVGIGCTPHQMGLCSATHPANLLNDDGHEAGMLTGRNGCDYRQKYVKDALDWYCHGVDVDEGF